MEDGWGWVIERLLEDGGEHIIGLAERRSRAKV
jgi:hypothetical protein